MFGKGIAKAVRAARENLELTPKSLARRAEVPVSCVRMIEGGDYIPPPKILKKVARGLGFNIQQLLTLGGCIQGGDNELKRLGKELLLAAQPILVQKFSK